MQSPSLSQIELSKLPPESPDGKLAILFALANIVRVDQMLRVLQEESVGMSEIRPTDTENLLKNRRNRCKYDNLSLGEFWFLSASC